MIKQTMLAMAAVAVFAAAPSQAATTFNLGGTLGDGPAQGTNATLGATLSLSLFQRTGSNWTFDYTLTNASGAGVNTASITVFGFNVVNQFSNVAVDDGAFGVRILNGGTAQAQGNLDFCLKVSSQNNCSSGNNGLAIGASAAGRFTILGVVGDTLQFDKVYVRYQGIDPSAFGGVQDNSAVGVLDSVYSFNAVPEPGTWALMIGGFGLTGYALRRRRTLAAA